MTIELFLGLLLITSILTSLFTEGIKKLIGESFKYSSNVLVAIIAVVIGIATCVVYCIFVGVTLNAQIITFFVCLIVGSWLCAMLGYDKVVQSISQIGLFKIDK